MSSSRQIRHLRAVDQRAINYVNHAAYLPWAAVIPILGGGEIARGLRVCELSHGYQALARASSASAVPVCGRCRGELRGGHGNGLTARFHGLPLSRASQDIGPAAGRGRGTDLECFRVSAGHGPGVRAVQDCRSVRIYASELCPRQDSNLRSRLRRLLPCTALTSANAISRVLPGRASGATSWPMPGWASARVLYLSVACGVASRHAEARSAGL